MIWINLVRKKDERVSDAQISEACRSLCYKFLIFIGVSSICFDQGDLKSDYLRSKRHFRAQCPEYPILFRFYFVCSLNKKFDFHFPLRRYS